jgi:hypothetical protein
MQGNVKYMKRNDFASAYEYRQLVEFKHVALYVDGRKEAFLTQQSITFASSTSKTDVKGL